MARIQLKSLRKAFDDVEAVRDVDLDIEHNEFVVLVGPSGCGKSTTLRMIAGLEEVSAGEIWLGDALVNDLPPRDRDIAMVFQSYALYPHMSVFKNMSFGLEMRKMPKDEIAARVQEAAEILDITELLDRRPGSSRAGNASAWRWAGPSFESPRRSSSTSPCRTWTRSCACRCAPRSSSSTRGSRLPSST